MWFKVMIRHSDPPTLPGIPVGLSPCQELDPIGNGRRETGKERLCLVFQEWLLGKAYAFDMWWTLREAPGPTSAVRQMAPWRQYTAGGFPKARWDQRGRKAALGRWYVGWVLKEMEPWCAGAVQAQGVTTAGPVAQWPPRHWYSQCQTHSHEKLWFLFCSCLIN